MKIVATRIFLCLSLLAPSTARLAGGSSSDTSRNRILSPAFNDQLLLLNDEFENNGPIDPAWTNQYPFRVSSSNVVDSSLTLIPDNGNTFGWYGTTTGVFLSKNIPAAVTNFVMETSLTVTSDTGGLLTSDWYSAGIMIRSSNNYGNFAQVNLGRQGPAFGLPRTYGTQAMSTQSGGSTFNYVAGDEDQTLSGLLRICRVGSQIVLLRNIAGDVDGWQPLTIQQNDDASATGYLQRADLTGDVEVGITMSRWRASDDNVHGTFDYVRFAAPSSFEECLVDDLDSLLLPVAPTDAPVEPPTDAPVVPPTDAPVEPPTDAPVEPPTDAPVVPPTDAPVEPPTDAPVEPPTDAPVEPPTDAPVEPPTPSPVNANEPVGALSDEFFLPDLLADEADDPTLLIGGWSNEYPDRYDSLSIGNGVLAVMPSGPNGQNVWYDNRHGSMISKRIPAGQDFVMETLVNVRQDSTNQPPAGDWHVSGLIARSVGNLDNWLTVNLGQQGEGPPGREVPRTLGVEGKTTSNAFSTFNYTPLTPEVSTPGLSARLRLCRVGSSFALLYRPLDSQAWMQISPYTDEEIDATVDRSDDAMDGEIDVGIMTNRMMAGPAFTARFDYIRFGEVSTLDDCFGGMIVS